MQFELSRALLDDIVYIMEDQSGVFFVDAAEGDIVGEETFENGELEQDTENRYIGLPEWDSHAGFGLMRQFTAGLKNKLVRSKLGNAMNQKKGVFRAFKNILADYPEVEQLWLVHKDRAKKQVVMRWYNALRAEWGLEQLGEEPEETGDLVQEDFLSRDPVPSDAEAAAELHRLCLAESRPLGAFPPWSFPGDLALVAETGGGDFAAYICGRETGGEAAVPTFEITALEVKPEYRGLGIGEALLTRLLEMTDARGIREVLIDIPHDARNFSRVLFRESFKARVTRYRRKAGQAKQGDSAAPLTE